MQKPTSPKISNAPTSYRELQKDINYNTFKINKTIGNIQKRYNHKTIINARKGITNENNQTPNNTRRATYINNIRSLILFAHNLTHNLINIKTSAKNYYSSTRQQNENNFPKDPLHTLKIILLRKFGKNPCLQVKITNRKCTVRWPPYARYNCQSWGNTKNRTLISRMQLPCKWHCRSAKHRIFT